MPKWYNKAVGWLAQDLINQYKAAARLVIEGLDAKIQAAGLKVGSLVQVADLKAKAAALAATESEKAQAEAKAFKDAYDLFA